MPDRRKKKVLIKTDVEHLRKLFIMPDSPDHFIEFGTELLDLIHNFFQEKGGIHSSISIPDLEKIFSNINIPKEAHLLKDVLLEIKKKIVAHSVKVGNPYYIGHMTSAVPYFMILLEMIIAALNQNQVKIESAKASTFVERELLSWMHKLVYNRNQGFYKANIQNREVALGNVTFDGTMANLTALLVARNKAFPPDERFPGLRKAGIVEAFRHYGYGRAVVLVSHRGHYSLSKAARIIGIGSDNVIKIPVDHKNKIDLYKLEEVCRDIRNANKTAGNNKIKIIAMVGIAGTTETGNIDNLREMGRIARENNAYFHVDAAWGGSVLLVDDYRYLFNGIEKADSVTIDAHKLQYTPVSMGMVLFRDETSLDHLKHTANYIIRPDSVDLGRFSVEGSRPFSALKPWATLKIFGTDGFKLLFEMAFELTSVLRGLIEVHHNFEPMNHPELFIFNYRFVPEKVRDKLETLRLKLKGKNHKSSLNELARIEKINVLLNELNIELHKDSREEDTSFVSRTMFDSPYYYYQNIVILRAITINPLTTPEILKEIIEAQNRIGLKIYKAEFASRLDRV
ncbi:MAG: aminotransferase class V-fold PLP-dependent enzyme [bacterium]|nr:aminotransferase class V-fold PLP-dependent enzyme [bacterium]